MPKRSECVSADHLNAVFIDIVLLKEPFKAWI